MSNQNPNIEPQLQPVQNAEPVTKTYAEPVVLEQVQQAQPVQPQTQYNQVVEQPVQQATSPALLQEYNAQEQEKIRQLATQIPVGNNEAIMVYGTNVQTKLSDFSDNMLKTVRQKDMGDVGNTLNELMVKLNTVKVGDLSKNPSVIDKLFNRTKRKVQEVIGQYKTVEGQIDGIVTQLQKTQYTLQQDIPFLDRMYNENMEYLKALDLYIVAGKLKVEEIQNGELAELQRKAQETNDMVVVQQVQDLTQFVDRLEKRVHDLILSKQIVLQSAPQIRLIQSTSQTLAEKIQSSILNTIPVWKNQIALTLTLNNQRIALESQKAVSDATNQILLKNSELLKTQTIETARENERGIVDVETLKITQANLIETIKETLDIQHEGKLKRIEAEKEMAKMEQDLKDNLTQIHRDNMNRSNGSSIKQRGDVVEQPVKYLDM